MGIGLIVGSFDASATSTGSRLQGYGRNGVFDLGVVVQAIGYYQSPATASAEATMTSTFGVTFPVRGVLNYNLGNPSSGYAPGPLALEGQCELLLTSSTGEILAHFGASAGSTDGTETLDLGILQPGVTYTFSGSVFARAQAEGVLAWTGVEIATYGRVSAGISAVVSVTPVPEPVPCALLAGVGLLGLAAVRRYPLAGLGGAGRGHPTSRR